MSKDDVDNAAFEEMILELVYNLKYLNLAEMQYDQIKDDIFKI